MTEDERRAIVDLIAADPAQGDEVPDCLLSILSKGDRANFDRNEVVTMKDFTAR